MTHIASIPNDGADFDALFAKVSKADKAIGQLHASDCMWLVDQVSRHGPDALPGVAAFVFTSIQQPFYSIQSRMADVRRLGVSSRFLFGTWKAGLTYVKENRVHLWNVAQDTVAGIMSHEDCLLEFMKVPGLGMVKASFFAQMTTGQGACMDGINLHRMGLREDHFKTNKGLSERTMRRKVKAYIAAWSSVGDSGYWWDSWCEFQGTRTTKLNGVSIGSAGDAVAVSKLHRTALCLEITTV